MTRKSQPNLLLTNRALRDIQGIYNNSCETWGRTVAERYLDQLEAGLDRVAEQPDLLHNSEELHPSLMFYQVNKHLLICDQKNQSVVVLTVVHVSMDITARLAELQPKLATEIELLHQRLASKNKKTKTKRRSK